MAETCICSYVGDAVVRHAKCPIHGDPMGAVEPKIVDQEDAYGALRELEAVRKVVTELTHKVQHLVDWLDEKGLLEDHAFTFPDGDVWKSQDIE